MKYRKLMEALHTQDPLRREKWMSKSTVRVVLCIILIGGVISYFSVGSPDGLERVAIDYGFQDRAASKWDQAPAADYQVKMVENGFMQNGLAGWIGAGLVFLMVWIWGKWLVRKNDGDANREN